MFKNMTPKQKIIIGVVVVVTIAIIIFFVVRSRKKKKQYAENAEKKISGGKTTVKPSEPTPAEGGKFRVIPEEDDFDNIQEENPAPSPQSQQQTPKKPQIQQKPHFNTTGKTRGGALPPMEEDLTKVRDNDESSFTGTLFNVDNVVTVSKAKTRKK